MPEKREILNESVEIAVRKLIEGQYYGREQLRSAFRLIKEKGYQFSPQELNQLLNKSGFPSSGKVIAHDMAENGYFFTMDQLMELGNPVDMLGQTAAHFMAAAGFVFTVDQLMQLGNPIDRAGGWTIAHKMASKGHFFTLTELLKLGNAKDHWGKTIADIMVEKGHVFTTEELLLLGNSACDGDWTMAHEMAKNGHHFRADEIIKLGNPIDCRGLTVADVMIINGQPFTEDEDKLLGIDRVNFGYVAYVSFDIRDYFSQHPSQPVSCPKCGNRLAQSSVGESKAVHEDLIHEIFPYHEYSYLFVCSQCHWWCIRERWGDNERMFDADTLIIGAAKSAPSSEINNERPWEKALSDEHAYSHDLKMPEYIKKMFSQAKDNH